MSSLKTYLKFNSIRLKLINKQTTEIYYAICCAVIFLCTMLPYKSFATNEIKQAHYQDLLVRGVVNNEDGIPISDVTVKIKGSTKETKTDAKGQFELVNVRSNDILSISSIGFKTKEILVGNQSFIEIELLLNNVTIDEVDVINTGYQRINKERAVGSFDKPNMESFHGRTSSTNVLQRLDGLVAGLTVNNAKTDYEGTGDNSLLVRGLSTIQDNRKPLVIVDGMQVADVSFVNPSDVADITVLKDASASAIYGAKASNGVIIITTKKGTLNQKLNFSYNSFYNMKGKPDLSYQKVLNSQQLIDAYKQVVQDPDYLTEYGFDKITKSLNSFIMGAGIAPHEKLLYDWKRGVIKEDEANSGWANLAKINNHRDILNNFYQNASTFNQNLSMSGGYDKYSFYGSLMHTKNNEQLVNDKNQQYKINLRQDFKLHDKINLYLISDLSTAKFKNTNTSQIDARFYPYQLFIDDNGNPMDISYLVNFDDEKREDLEKKSNISLAYNPLLELGYNAITNKRNNVRLSSGLNIDLYKGFSFEGVYGYVRGNDVYDRLIDEKSYLVRSEVVQFTTLNAVDNTANYILPNKGGHYIQDNRYASSWTARSQINYKNKWKDGVHDVNGLIGYEAQEQKDESVKNYVRGYNEQLMTSVPIDYFTLSKNGISSPIWTNMPIENKSYLNRSNNPFVKSELVNRFLSYYANMGYTYNNKYSFNASWRIDESNLFGKDKSAQNKPVWSLGGRWDIFKENFISKDQNWLNRLALRVSYGITGNSPAPGTASSYDIFSAINNTDMRVLNLETPANPKLTWERTNTFNIGANFGLFNNRLSGSIDYYNKYTSDLITNMEVNNLTGFQSVVGNLGDILNQGIEINLTSQNILSKDFMWSSGLILSYNKNQLKKFFGVVPIQSANQMIHSFYVQDYLAFSLFAYNYAGLNADGNPQVFTNDGNITSDANLSNLSKDDVIHMGSYQPSWSGGVNNVFKHREFTLTANIAFYLGHYMRRDVNKYFSGRLTHTNVVHYDYTGNLHAEFENRWKNSGDENLTDIPKYIASGYLSSSQRNIDYYINSNRNVLKASYIKLRDITLNYALPLSMINTLKLQNANVFVQMSNIMLWKANKYDIDPEFHDAIQGDRFLRTNQGTTTVGVNFNF